MEQHVLSCKGIVREKRRRCSSRIDLFTNDNGRQMFGQINSDSLTFAIMQKNLQNAYETNFQPVSMYFHPMGIPSILSKNSHSHFCLVSVPKYSHSQYPTHQVKPIHLLENVDDKIKEYSLQVPHCQCTISKGRMRNHSRIRLQIE